MDRVLNIQTCSQVGQSQTGAWLIEEDNLQPRDRNWDEAEGDGRRIEEMKIIQTE